MTGCLNPTRTFLPLVLAGGLLACSSPPPPERPRSRPAGETGPDEPEQRQADRGREEVRIGGLMGTIDESAVEKAFGSRMSEVRRCRSQHVKGLPYVGGTVTFFFKIGEDGVPTQVLLERSDLGHHEMNACLLRIAKTLKFVKPQGGQAEVRYSMDLADDGVQAKAWPASKVSRVMRSRRSALMACRKGGRPRHFSVTFYVLPQGNVKTAGVVSSEPLPDDFAACVAKVIMESRFPDPLGDVARVTVSF